MFGALVFIMVAWLAFDAYSIRKDFLTASRGIGFALLAVSQVIRGFSFEMETYEYLGFVLFILGLVLVLWNLLLEKPVERPSLTKNYAVVLLPSFATASFYFNSWAIFLLFAITYLSYKQYKREDKRSLKPFIISFALLTISTIFSFNYVSGQFDLSWILGRSFELGGFIFLAVWVWQYLQLRIREELILIFFSFALMISIVVTFAFSMILINQIENSVKNNLIANSRSFEYLILHLKEEALAKSRLFSSNVELREALLDNDFKKIDSLSGEFMRRENLGFLTVSDSEGNVILRAHSTTKKGDSILGSEATERAFDGFSVSTIDDSPVENFSIRSVSPMIFKGSVMGFVSTGFLLDEAFVGDLKKLTGLDVSVFENDTVVASTIIGHDGRTRIRDIKLGNEEVYNSVIGQGRTITMRTDVAYKPFIASFFPLKNIDGENVGMLSIARSQRDIFAIANTTNILTLISVVIIMMILAFPIFRITKKLIEF